MLEDRMLLAATLVRDINEVVTGTGSSNPTQMTVVGDIAFFAAQSPDHGFELWKSDGTVDGTMQVKDIRAGVAGSYPSILTNLGGILYFTANDGTNGFELWRSDGTAEGTLLIKDIRAGTYNSYLVGMTNVNGTLYFSARDAAGGSELWKSDGTTAGTVQVQDILPGATGSYPSSLTNVNGTLFFSARDAAGVGELWKSDGTTAGTVRVKNNFAGTSGSYPSNLTNVNGTLFFSGRDAAGGGELWKSDGTAVGTIQVKDIFAGAGNSAPRYLTDINGVLFFVARDALNDFELWKSDGTASGTLRVKDIFAGTNASNPRYLTNMNGTLYFSASDATGGIELWKSNGTNAGTLQVKDINVGVANSNPRNLMNLGGTLYFNAAGANGSGLWKSDGTDVGTVFVASVSLTGPSTQINLNGNLLFAGVDSSAAGIELWRSDGTSSGTSLVKDIFKISGNADPQNGTNVNGVLYFTASDGLNGQELWKSDGTEAGTVLVHDIRPGSGGSSPSNLTNVNGIVYFTATDGLSGTELWRTDGTSAGTSMVADIRSGSGSYPSELTNVGGTLYFSATDATNGTELWKTDGSLAGTTLVKDLGAGNSNPLFLTNVGGILYFNSVNRLVKSDGTAAGTIVIPGVSSPSRLKESGGALYFAASSAAGFELWRSDGTESGTKLVRDIVPGASSGLTGSIPFVDVSGVLYFVAGTSSSGTELWRSDGTIAGTRQVMDIFPGTQSSYPKYLTNVNGALYFSAASSSNSGIELWKSDGSVEGTELVRDINANAGSNPRYLTNVAGTLFFSANNGTFGYELWRSDGSYDGTVIAADFAPGATSGNPRALQTRFSPASFVEANQKIYFRGTTIAAGAELFVVDASGPQVLLGTTTFDYTGNSDLIIQRNGTNIEISEISGLVVAAGSLTAIQRLTINNALSVSVDFSTGGIFSLTNGLQINAGQGFSNSLTVNGTGFSHAMHSVVNGPSAQEQVVVTENGFASTIRYHGFEDRTFDGFLTFGGSNTLHVDSGSLTVGSVVPVNLPFLTSVAGGTITASSVAVGAGEAIVGSGSINARLSAELGSLIQLSGDLTIGNSASTAGVNTRGDLVVNNYVATLLDSNQAVLGSLTSLGSVTTAGTVIAANGALIDFGNNLVGFGTLNTPNLASKPTIINGSVDGTSLVNPVTLSGFVKGVGSLNNVSFTGTYSPGFSPAAVTLGSVIYSASSVSIIEIGGTLPGSQHDQLNHTSQALLGGTLQVELLNGFQPAIGDSFEFLTTASGVIGTFNTELLPVLPSNRRWELVYGSNSVVLNVVDNPAAPSNISLTSSSIAENAGPNAVVGILSFTDPDVGDTATFSLPAGIGSNNLFNIAPDGTTLRANGDFNFEVLSSYSITVRVIDAGGLAFDKLFAINVNDVNESPSSLSLSNANVSANARLGTSIGTFTTVDPDSGSSFALSLVSGTGDNDNSKFQFIGNSLLMNSAFDYGLQKTLSIRVRTTDQTGLFFEDSFNITLLRGVATVVEDLIPGGGISSNGNSSDPSLMIDVSGTTYFVANNVTNGIELWRINSSGGAEIVEDAVAGGGINLGSSSSTPSNLTNVSGMLYFRASDGVSGTELWRINSSGVAELVEDAVAGGGIRPGSSSSSPNNLTNVNGTLYFTANDGSSGTELWRISSSGIAEMVEDAVAGGGINPGVNNSGPGTLTNVNGTLYFIANDGSSGAELWRINISGVAEMVEDAVVGGGIRPGSSGSTPSNLTNVNGTLYFGANDGANGTELWRINSSGVAEMIDDALVGGGIRPGITSAISGNLTNVNGTLYFGANDGVNGTELWRINSSGVAEMVEDAEDGGGINPGSANSVPNNLTNVNGTLYFSAGNGVNGEELWRINGSGVAEMVEDAVVGGGINPGSNSSTPTNLTNLNGTLYFSANDGANGDELWRINISGVAEMVEDAAPGGGINSGSGSSSPELLTNVNGTLYFNASDGVNGTELWWINSSGVAQMAEDAVLGGGINSGSSSSSPQFLTNVNGSLYFSANDIVNGQELWRINSSGVAELVEVAVAGGGINPGSKSSATQSLTNINGTLYFSASDGVNGTELWRINSSGVAELVEDAVPGGGINAGSSNSFPTDLTNVNGTLYFAALSSLNGNELWRINSSGVAEIVEDAVAGGGINPGDIGSYPGLLTNINGTLYFSASDGVNGNELWRINSSGVAEMVEDDVVGGGINPGINNSAPSNFENVNGTMYFRASDGVNGTELWRINSSGAAEMVEDAVAGGGINPGVNNSSPRYLTNVNGTLYFSASDVANGIELWRINSAGAAEMVEDASAGGGINPGVDNSSPSYLTNVNGTLYFRAFDAANGEELWRISLSGSAEMVEDSVPGGGINPGSSGSDPRFLTNVNGTLYFSASDVANGIELWRINSAGAAEMVEDALAGGGISPGSYSAVPAFLTNVNGTLYFAANDSVNGGMLWRINSSGVAEMVEDAIAGGGIRPGSDGSGAGSLTNVNGTLYFGANDGANGNELWRINNSGVAQIVDDAVAGGGINPGTGSSNPSQMIAIGNNLYFVADDGFANGQELWVLTLNSAPTDLSLSSQPLAENAGSNAFVGTLSFTDPDPGEVGIFSLPAGIGSNDLFNIAPDGTTLRANGDLNFEVLSSHSITVRVTDADGLSLDRQFTINVTDVNESPTITSIEDRTTAFNTTVSGITFTIGDPETDPSLLVVTGASSNSALAPVANFVFTGTGASRSLSITPATGQFGTSIITVTVSDGTNSTTSQFNLTVQPAAIAGAIVNRRVFYNGGPGGATGFGASTNFSATGGNPPATAIDSKVALLPGQNSGFVNYTNTSFGLNGIIVDIANPIGTLTAADFSFAKGGTLSQPGFVPFTATELSTTILPVVTQFVGGGENGSTRAKITFNNNSLKNTWVKVTVLASGNSGLTADDVFYFGNVAGDVNGSITAGTRYTVNTLDTSAVRSPANQSTIANSVLVTNIYDFNKTGNVNSLDTSAVRGNQQTTGIVLVITGAQARGIAPPQAPLFSVPLFSAPAILAKVSQGSTLETIPVFGSLSNETIVQTVVLPHVASSTDAAVKDLFAQVTKLSTKSEPVKSSQTISSIDDFFAQLGSAI